MEPKGGPCSAAALEDARAPEPASPLQPGVMVTSLLLAGGGRKLGVSPKWGTPWLWLIPAEEQGPVPAVSRWKVSPAPLPGLFFVPAPSPIRRPSAPNPLTTEKRWDG